MIPLWKNCLAKLEKEILSQQFSTFIKPLHTQLQENALVLLAPNHFVKGWIKDKFLKRIEEIIAELNQGAREIKVLLEVGSHQSLEMLPIHGPAKEKVEKKEDGSSLSSLHHRTHLNSGFDFENFVVGKSNQLAKAACYQVAENPGSSYNPLLLYGGVGLGKTHLIHAIGNFIHRRNPKAKILYLSSTRFVTDMVKALQTNTMDSFKSFYCSLDLLLIDDIQFLAGKERSQEEFFTIFNSLFENRQQIILTSDRYPKEIDKLEERLKSRLGWGLPVFIEPPELETRVAILKTKAQQANIEISDDTAFFIAKRVSTNVRELEGALKRVIANANFTGKLISVEFARETLKDLISLQDKLITMENILKTVADYYKIRLSDLLSANRSRVVARPRQMAMSLAKELTQHSLPEIGSALGGRDHTTVLHACRQVKELIKKHRDIATDYENLLRILSS